MKIEICDLMWKDDSGRDWALEKTLQDLSEMKNKEWAFELLKRIISSIFISDRVIREIVEKIRVQYEQRTNYDNKRI